MTGLLSLHFELTSSRMPAYRTFGYLYPHLAGMIFILLLWNRRLEPTLTFLSLQPLTMQ